MKAIKFIMLLVVIVVGSAYYTGLSAQEKIKTLIGSCEDLTDIDRKTEIKYGDGRSDIKYINETIHINNNKKLIDDFLKAFEEEKVKSFNVMEKTRGGKVFLADYHFLEENLKENCRFYMSDSSTMVVTYIGEKIK